MMVSLIVLCLLALQCGHLVNGQYQPTWDSLDKRPLPPWYDQAKIGVFLHWGLFSVPGFGSEWFWWYWQGQKSQSFVDFMNGNYRPGFSYPEFASQFKAEFYDPNSWADLFEASGIKYVVLTSKHHEGFTMWPSNVSWNWNAKDVGPRRDLLGDLASAIRNKTDIHFGVYHSMFEWFHPLYLMDKNSTWKTQYFVDTKTLPELVELVMKYKPEVIWSDGDWEAPDTYWKSTEFLAWLYNKSPVKDVIVVNDRWGSGMPCHHGGFFTCTDKYNPKTLQPHKWENAMTLDKGSWGYRRNIALSDFLTIDELITTLAETVSCGGNLLLNVGPSPDGRIIPIFEERLRQLGAWLKVNGEAIYETTPWTYQNDTITPGVWYTTKEGDGESSVYAIVLSWPKMNQLFLGSLQLQKGDNLYMLGVEQPLVWQLISPYKTLVIFPNLTPLDNPSQTAWVLKVTQSTKESNDIDRGV